MAIETVLAFDTVRRHPRGQSERHVHHRFAYLML